MTLSDHLRILLVFAALFMLTACGDDDHDHAAAPAGKNGWLTGDTPEKFNTIADQFRGNDLVMWEVGYRYQELYWTASTGNWDAALYQITKIGKAMRMGKERRPKRAISYDLFFKASLEPMHKIVEAKDAAAFARQFPLFTQGCNDCHAREQLQHFHVAVPTQTGPDGTPAHRSPLVVPPKD